MRMPVEAIHQRILRSAHEAGFDDVVEAHFAVLRYPGPQGRRPSDLAAEAGVSKQAMNYLLGQLEGLGYVVRSGDADDKRSRRVNLTARGEALRTVIRTTVRAVEDELEAELGTTDYAQLKRLLGRLNDTPLVRELHSGARP